MRPLHDAALDVIEAAATVQPGAEHSTLFELTGGDVHGLVLDLVGEVRALRRELADR